ncbi:MAG: hypothetical protein JXB85_05875 [Anaerolineales bacterium]|nr:hypothetical protein [Anaerolineales bacterium]
MKNQLLRAFKLPWYPLCVAAYPVLALLQMNLSEIRLEGALRPLLAVVAATLALLLFLRLFYRDWQRAAFGSAVLALLFFTYGHVINLLQEGLKIANLPIWLGGLWLGLALLGLFWATRRKVKFEKTAPILNVVSLGLVLVVTIQAAHFSAPQGDADLPADEHAPRQTLQVPQGEIPPDIYYIIVDSYGRSDLLEYAFRFDNSQFITDLEALGFYVAGCAQSNYNRTDVSLASSLNLDYLHNLSADYQPEGRSRRRLWASIDDSAVRIMLEEVGYTSVSFATGFAWSEVDHADVFMEPSSMSSTLTEFEILLLRTTPLRHLEDQGWINLDAIDGWRYRDRTDYIFASMDELAAMPGPQFVFIHIIPPHPPFVYGPEGEWTDPASFLNADRRYTSAAYTEGYVNQAAYISQQLTIAVRTLLEESATPPVIIIQGDHAPWMQSGARKFLILNAYYLPGHNDLLYPTISPVNTFRLVFNTYLGGDYEILPDTSYYSPIPNIYEFEAMFNVDCPLP